jgi:hypothetical protein
LDTWEHPDWTLRIPVVQARFATWIDHGVVVAAAAAAAVSLYWQVLPGAAAMATGAAICAAAGLAFRRRSRISGMLFSRSGAVYVRLRRGWQPLTLAQAWRGWRCLTVQGELPAAVVCNDEMNGPGRDGPGRDGPGSRNSTGGNAIRRPVMVTFTLWQDALAPQAWRRVCLLTGRRLRQVPLPRVPEAS